MLVKLVNNKVRSNKKVSQFILLVALFLIKPIKLVAKVKCKCAWAVIPLTILVGLDGA